MSTSSWQETHERLRGEADREYPPPWQPAPGDELIGTVVAVNPSAHTVHGPRPVVEIAEPNGDRVSVWLHSKVLRRQFERADIRLGETVLIRYRGKVDRDNEPSYHDFKLVVDRPQSNAPVDWRRIAQAHGDHEPGDEPEHGPGENGRLLPAPDGPPPYDDDDIPF